MREILAVFGGLLVCLPTSLVFAKDRVGGYYAGLQVTGSYAEVDNFSTTGTNEFAAIDTKDMTIGTGAVLGYQWRGIPIRTEFEAGYRFRFDFDSRDNVGPVSFKTDIATTTFLYNIAYEYRNNTGFTPFVGATIGWARHTANLDRNLQDTNGQFNSVEDTDNFAYGGFFGVNWAFSDHWSTELAYRYMQLGEVNTGTVTTGESLTAEEYSAHDFLITVKYGF